jgi:hypothetical protein
MNTKDKQNLKKIMQTIKELADKAELNSNTLVMNGQENPIENRYKSRGYCDAYRFCYQLLDQFLYNEQL